MYTRKVFQWQDWEKKACGSFPQKPPVRVPRGYIGEGKKKEEKKSVIVVVLKVDNVSWSREKEMAEILDRYPDIPAYQPIEKILEEGKKRMEAEKEN